jgi:hypothetical protein
VIAVVPLIDLSSKVFHVSEETDLKAFDASATWVLLIISSIFFTVGSYVFVRAFESPPKPPLSNWKHFSTDELLAAWLYLFAMSPYIPYSMFYINVNRHRYVYWGAFFASCFFVAASAFFVYTCYPSHHHMLVSVLLYDAFARCFQAPIYLASFTSRIMINASYRLSVAILEQLFSCFNTRFIFKRTVFILKWTPLLITTTSCISIPSQINELLTSLPSHSRRRMSNPELFCSPSVFLERKAGCAST